MARGCSTRAWRRRFARRTCRITRLDTARSGELETTEPGAHRKRSCPGRRGEVRRSEFSAQAAYFRTDGSDVIIRSPTGLVINGAAEVTKKNASDLQVDGIEAQLTYQVLPQLLLLRMA
jgi:hemoglobin/transferrin/lactoferrin receptor protein